MNNYFQELKADERRRKNLESTKKYQKNNRDKVNAVRRKWVANNPERAKEIRRLERLRGKEKRKAYLIEYYKKNGDKVKARNTANRYIKLEDKSCVVCKSTKSLEKHHPDYSKALEVIIVCRPCHTKHHKSKEGLNVIQ